MANKIVETNIQARELVPITSRYYQSQIIYYGDQHKTTFKTYKRVKITESPQDKYMEINSSYEYRPDKVSQLAYGTVDFWWLIMEANGIKDVFDFKAGVNIRIPANMFSL